MHDCGDFDSLHSLLSVKRNDSQRQPDPVGSNQSDAVEECVCFVFARAGLHKVRTSCVWPEGGVSVRAESLASLAVRVVVGVEVRLLEELPFQLHTHNLDVA